MYELHTESIMCQIAQLGHTAHYNKCFHKYRSTVEKVKKKAKHTHAVWLHNNCVWDVRENTDAVSSVLAEEEAVSLEIEAVDIYLCAQSWQVPRYFICLTHGQAWEVPIHKPIDG